MLDKIADKLKSWFQSRKKQNEGEFEIHLGPKLYINPEENRRKQKESLKYGFMYAVPIGFAMWAPAAIIIGEPLNIFSSILFIIGFGYGFYITLRYVQLPNNRMREHMGGFDGIQPYGWGCYHPSFYKGIIGRLTSTIAVVESSLDAHTFYNAETGDEDPIQFPEVRFNVNRFYPMWILPYVRTFEKEGQTEKELKTQIAERVNSIILAAIRAFIQKHKYDEIMTTEGAKDDFKDALNEYLYKERYIIGDVEGKGPLASIGIFIPHSKKYSNTGVQLEQIDPPKDIVEGASEVKQARFRVSTVSELHTGISAIPGVEQAPDVNLLTKLAYADAGVIDFVEVGGGAEDFTKGAAVKTSRKRRS